MSQTEDLQKIGEACQVIAYSIFSQCGAASDFCIQHASPESVVFGGTNRLILHFRSGWYADRSYCSSRFLERWDAIKHDYFHRDRSPA
jgi:hypothetical protein